MGKSGPEKEPSPRRVEAGRRNRQLQKGFTEAGRAILREGIFERKPWLHSTGPGSAAGKAKSARNGRLTKKGYKGTREAARAVSAANKQVRKLRMLRAEIHKCLQGRIETKE